MQILAGIVSSEDAFMGGKKAEDLYWAAGRNGGERIKKCTFEVGGSCQQIFCLLINFNLKSTLIWGDKANESVSCDSWSDPKSNTCQVSRFLSPFPAVLTSHQPRCSCHIWVRLLGRLNWLIKTPGECHNWCKEAGRRAGRWNLKAWYPGQG